MLSHLRSSFSWSLSLSFLFHGLLFAWAWLCWSSTELPALHAHTPGRCTIELMATVAPTATESVPEVPVASLPVLTQINVPLPELPVLPTRQEIADKLIDVKNRLTEQALKKLTEMKEQQLQKEKKQPQPEAVDSPGSIASQGARVDEHPTLPYQAPPRYPRELLAAGVEGRVVVRVLVRADGTVATSRIQESSGYKPMDESALETSRDWRFRPARRGNAAVACEVDVPIRFYIRER